LAGNVALISANTLLTEVSIVANNFARGSVLPLLPLTQAVNTKAVTIAVIVTAKTAITVFFFIESSFTFYFQPKRAVLTHFSLALLAFSCYIYSMTVTQTVDIPADHRIMLEVPREVPPGRTILAFTPARSPDTVRLPGGNARTVEEALQMAAEKLADPNRKPISMHFSILSPNTYGDGVAYQRKIRDEEWDD
jgi:hypothetical protein